jgi:hypothetical protein
MAHLSFSRVRKRFRIALAGLGGIATRPLGGDLTTPQFRLWGILQKLTWCSENVFGAQW